MLRKITSALPPAGASAPMLLQRLAFAIRIAFASLLSAGFIDHVHAQTAPKAKQEAAGDETTLSEVRVSAERSDALPRPYAGGQVARGGRLGLLGNTDVMKAPFSISSYTSQMIQDQQAVWRGS